MKAEARERGFTLLELMIVLGIVALMASIAVPSFTRMIRAQKVLTASNSFIGAVALTRSEAINRGTGMTICATLDPNATAPTCSGGTDWANGWLIYPTAGGVGNLIKVGMPNEGVTMIAGGGVVPFDSRGIPLGAGSMEVNASDCTPGKDKQIIISINSTGRLSSVATVPSTGDCP